MYVKVVNHKSERGYPCSHHVKTVEADGRIVIELCGGGPDVPPTVTLLPLDHPARQPDDPHAVFIVSDARDTAGNTVDRIWAPKFTTNGAATTTNLPTSQGAK
jgi:hypothetical protein